MENRIREIRGSKNITQSQLASDIGISRQYLSDLEKGSSEPGLKIALALSERLNSPIEYIFFNSLSYKTNKEASK